MRTCRDAAYPPPDWPAADATLVYAGGDTPNPWTGAGLPPYVGASRACVPAWVRSNPAAASFDADGHAMIAWLRSRDAPIGCLTMLDLETAKEGGYVMGYGATLHSAGYLVAPYGSTSTLFDNPELDGYWPDAGTTVQSGLDNHAGVIATQYGPYGTASGGEYDLSVIADGIPLWDLTSQPDLREATDMQIGWDQNGKLIIVGIAVDDGNLLQFVEDPPGTWRCIDVTYATKVANPADPRLYQIKA